MGGFYEETILVGVDEQGHRVGECHPMARLSDHDVELIRELAEGGMSYRVIAEKFEISKGTVCGIITYRRRYAYAVSSKRVMR